LWRRFAPLVAIDPDEPQFKDNAPRVAGRLELLSRIEEAYEGRRRDDVLAELEAAGIPAGRVRTLDEVYAWEQTRSQGLAVNVQHALLGALQLPGPPLRFFEPSGRETTRREHLAPPLLGEHTQRVRGSIGRVTA
jgi:formyl-CoA transferase